MTEDSDREIIWQVKPDEDFLKREKRDILLYLCCEGLLGGLVLLDYAVTGNFFAWLSLSVLVVVALIILLVIGHKRIKRVKAGQSQFYIDSGGIGYYERYYPKEDIEFFFLDYTWRGHTFIKTKKTPLVRVENGMDKKEFFKAVPSMEVLKHPLNDSLIPDKEEFINALKECGIKVYVSRGYGAPVEEV